MERFSIVVMSVVFLLAAQAVYAQGDITFAGMVVNTSDGQGVRGVAVYNRSTLAAVVSDSVGFYQLKASVGDTLQFKHAAYDTEIMVVPQVLDGLAYYGYLQALTPKEAKASSAFQLPSRRDFRKAFASKEFEKINRPEGVPRNIMKTLRKSYENDKYYYDIWQNGRLYQVTGKVHPNNVLNPHQWEVFIEGLGEEDDED